MTRKDYIKIAEVLRELPKWRNEPLDSWGKPYDAVRYDFVVLRMADMLERDNPRFNRSKFLKACNL